jgi:hypothetical protein
MGAPRASCARRERAVPPFGPRAALILPIGYVQGPALIKGYAVRLPPATTALPGAATLQTTGQAPLTGTCTTLRAAKLGTEDRT